MSNDDPTQQGMPPWEPPFHGTENEHLAGMLDRLRTTFRWKADGLDDDGLRFTLPTSALSLGALLKHLAVCEDDVFGWRIAGERPDVMADMPEGADLFAWQWELPDDPADVYALYDAAVERSRARLAVILDAGRLEAPGHLTFGEIRPSIRRHVCDLVEEYGRHTGHADLIREALDGRVGEDPPDEWRPVS
ncbi:mycothiol transferase [Mobilicoccus massiliensis]|uniref:mycothiol transferase n=1 Tax=Mobilicoccus massiliensis TaxID=1522310 RepID=UPI000693DE17|nr:DUF664 domain-containing protein [Mobilicoccus massiliensis]